MDDTHRATHLHAGACVLPTALAVGEKVGAGGLGYCMRKFSVPVAPLIIGFLLGLEAKLTLRHSLMLSQGSLSILFDHPIALVFLALTTIIIIKMSLRKKGGIKY